MITVSVVDEEFTVVEPMHPRTDTTMLSQIILALSSTDGLRGVPFIDPYGETLFNRLQAPVLRSELDWLASEHPSAAAVCAELQRLTAMVEEEVHLYLRFSGD